MNNPFLPYTLVIANLPVRSTECIPVADLADASHAYLDFMRRFRPTTRPTGRVEIGGHSFEITQDGTVMLGENIVVMPQ